MSNLGATRYRLEFMNKLYPAFSRRATQVCILSMALEKIARGAGDAVGLAQEALNQADAFDWKARSANDTGRTA